MRKLLPLFLVLLAAPLAAQTTYPVFGPATGILKGSTSTPMTTAATAADVVALWASCSTNEYLNQSGTCSLIDMAASVTGILPVANGGTGVSSLGNITRTNDTNVTLTLGGTPTGAVINSTSLTLGWSGTLAASRGGLGMSTVTDDTLAVANGTTWQSKAVPDCDSSTGVLQYDATTNAFSCGTNASPSGAALTDVDDTNVTLTLGGSPSTALVNAASITAGWSGTLAASRGGLGMSTVTDDTVAVANGTTWQSKALTDCDAATSAVTYDTTANTWGCNTINGATGANPTASVGLSAVNGVASTFMRSDAAPALSQSIAPTWTGNHSFTALPTASNGTNFTSARPGFWFVETDQAADNTTWRTSSEGSTYTIAALDDARSAVKSAFEIDRSGNAVTDLTLGNTTDNPTIFLRGAAVVGSATGGSQGTGTVNASALYDDGQQVVGANPSGTIGLSAVNGSAVSYMRSDGAPALSQSIAPTWTAPHIFSSSGVGSSTAVYLQSATPYMGWRETDQGAGSQDWLLGATASVWRLGTSSDGSAVDRNAIAITRGASIAVSDVALGNATNNPTFSFLGTGTVTTGGPILAPDGSTSAYAYSNTGDANTGVRFPAADQVAIGTGGTDRLTIGPGVQVGSPTGGDQGAGTLNATGLYINGVAVAGAGEVTVTFATQITSTNVSTNCTVGSSGTGSTRSGINTCSRTGTGTYSISLAYILGQTATTVPVCVANATSSGTIRAAYVSMTDTTSGTISTFNPTSAAAADATTIHVTCTYVAD